MVGKNRYVEIKRTLLEAGERSKSVPAETQSVPLELRMRGTLLAEANIGDRVTIETETGRIEEGILVSVDPFYDHGFGGHVEELRAVRQRIRKDMRDSE
ncbi:MAG: 2-amino-4-oxopentanoate thiolase subunit OrtA [Acholeplasmataceae bacterium]